MKTPGPFTLAALLGALALLVAFAPVAWRMLAGGPAPPAAVHAGATSAEAPWSISEPAPGRTRVFGFELPGTTLEQVRSRWGDDLALAVIAATSPRDAVAAPRFALEGYVERFQAAGVAGRLLLTFEADPETLERWAAASPGEPTESGARRHVLAGNALTAAASSVLVGMSLIPAAQLDAGIVTARFGAPAERLRENARLEHWLYPAVGLAVALDSEGKELLQYVAPADFERRLAAPLRTLRALPAPDAAR